MVLVQRVSLWLAAIFGSAGIAFIVIYILTSEPQGYLLFSAVVAAGLSAVALLTGVVFVCLESVWRVLPNLPRIVPPKPKQVAKSALAEQFEERQEVLKERLNIDEPHFCTKAQAPCTSWSFCGSAPGKRTVRFVEAREGEGAYCSYEAEHQDQPLPVVERSSLSNPCLAILSDAERCPKPPPRNAEGH